MRYSLVISEKAELQIEKAAHWFCEQSSGLEKKFLMDLEKSMDFISKHPLKCQKRYKSVRVKYLKNFDFGIHYIVENETVFVFYLFHTSQNSDNWFF